MLWYDWRRDVKSCQTLSSRLAACPLHPLPHFPKGKENCIDLLPKGAREREQIPVRRNHFWQATCTGCQLGATSGGQSLVSTLWPCVKRRPGNFGFILLCHKGADTGWLLSWHWDVRAWKCQVWKATATVPRMVAPVFEWPVVYPRSSPEVRCYCRGMGMFWHGWWSHLWI